jgi:hypothetical protein
VSVELEADERAKGNNGPVVQLHDASATGSTTKRLVKKSMLK